MSGSRSEKAGLTLALNLQIKPDLEVVTGVRLYMFCESVTILS